MAAAERVYNFERFSPRQAVAAESKQAPKAEKPANIIELPGQLLRQSRRKRVKPLRAVANAVGVLLVCTVLGAIIYGQVQLTELNEEISTVSAQLSEAQSIELQLQYAADQNMSTAELEEYASTKLGMQKINPGQVTYIQLADGNNGTVVREIDSKPWFLQIWDSVLALLS